MVMWPMLSLIGFLVMTALVIAMGTKTTARYEAEKQAASGLNRSASAEPARAVATATAVL